MIDDDLGRSGGGIARPDSRSCWLPSAKAVSALSYRSRPRGSARNGRDWHTLLEFCGLVGSLIVDEDGVYDPRLRTTDFCSA